MANRDHTRLIHELTDEYTRRFPRSATLHNEAELRMIDGGNHLVRLMEPFPFRLGQSHGAYVCDVDDHKILDYWQGHMANILGHNPPQITQPLAEALQDGWGLQSGFADELQIEVARLIAERTGAERVRFTTSGTLCTMYAIMLCRSFTGRSEVLKIGGGWHGAQPWALKGISVKQGSYDHIESEGLPAHIDSETLVTRYNDVQALEDVFTKHGDRIACFIMEPWMGSGGSMPATPEYMRAARDLTRKYGAMLILDEVIAGFRFRAGNLGAMYGVQPDLTTMAKIIGGGMPVAAVAGRADILALCGRKNGEGRRVRFDGGTYSAHPLSLLASKLMIEYLVAHEDEVYPRIAAMGERLRKGIEKVFADRGILACCTGHPNSAVPGSSLASVHFPATNDLKLSCPDQVGNPALSDITLRETVMKLGLLVQDVNVSHGIGAVSMAHSDADIARTLEAVDHVAKRIASE